jgi:hypothetical protein
MTAPKSKTPLKTKLYDISLLGIFRALAGMPVEHPLDTLKTWMQSEN